MQLNLSYLEDDFKMLELLTLQAEVKMSLA